jgi:hypothetical protein
LETVGAGFLYERVEQLNAQVQELTRIRGADLDHIGRIEAQLARLDLMQQSERALLEAINAGCDDGSSYLGYLAEQTEKRLATDLTLDRNGIHRDIGRAIFARSRELYCGEGLPDYLRRYTYPPMISIALTSHCNAACFFCREADYKGTSVNFENLVKLESAIKNARNVDLTR